MKSRSLIAIVAFAGCPADLPPVLAERGEDLATLGSQLGYCMAVRESRTALWTPTPEQVRLRCVEVAVTAAQVAGQAVEARRLHARPALGAACRYLREAAALSERAAAVGAPALQHCSLP